MKLGIQSRISVIDAIKKALNKYFIDTERDVLTDIHLQPILETGELVVYNDEEEELSRSIIPAWVDCNPEEFYMSIETVLEGILVELNNEGYFDKLNLIKPYSFVLIDEEKETVADLLLVDENETVFINDELLKGLDEELNLFLKDLLEN